MKIKEIRFTKHKILKDLRLNFTDENGHIADTIILAGENGCGKSTILKSIFDALNYRCPLLETGSMGIHFKLTESEVEALQPKLRFSRWRDDNKTGEGIQNNEIVVRFQSSQKNVDIQQRLITWRDNYGKKCSRTFENDAYLDTGEKIPQFKCLFSDVEINFNPEEIRSVTSQDIDKDIQDTKHRVPRPGEPYRTNIATEITQLLVDIQTLDNSDFTNWSRDNRKFDGQKLDLRISRFKDAFNYIFPNLQYKNVRSIHGLKQVIFEGPLGEVPITSLSSGEKQIVFRGSFLLRNKTLNDGAIVLIDEPEISLHPRWQRKIVDFTKRLFTNDSGLQTSQLIFATHSPFVIHNVSRVNDKVIIVEKDLDGDVSCMTKPSFYGWTPEEKIKTAFNIDSLPKNATVFVEGSTDETYLNRARDILYESDLPFSIQWIGRMEGRKAKFGGDKSLDQAREFFVSNPQFLRQKVVLLYDSDVKKLPEGSSNLFISKMPYQGSNSVFKKGIENLLALPSDFDANRFYI
ncbi:MAG: AAA family ATPase, partial [Cyanobacteria bacterium P01_A01_bin.137]